jgi:hypothetical protein
MPLYGSYSRWATTEDIKGTAWENEVVIDLPCDIGDTSDDQQMVTGEDLAGGLDVPPIGQPIGKNEPRQEDLAYGKDEPRPGC